MQFAPDGRLFVCQQGGALRVIKNGALLTTPFVSLVQRRGERGLLGVAFDPNFAGNQYVYVYYTTSTAPVHNRVSRFTANGDVALAGHRGPDRRSRQPERAPPTTTAGPSTSVPTASSTSRSATTPTAATRSRCRPARQDAALNSDGSIPTDNPSSFPGVTGSPSGANRAIWAVGLRNPFTFALNPGGTPPLLINDVGQRAREEVNLGSAGANYGWPCTEGVFGTRARPPIRATPTPTQRRPAPSPAARCTAGVAESSRANTRATISSPTLCGGLDSSSSFDGGPSNTHARLRDRPRLAGRPEGVGPTAASTIWPADRRRRVRVHYCIVSPAITTHPADRTASAGQSALFIVVVIGAAPFTLPVAAHRRRHRRCDLERATPFPRRNSRTNGAHFRVNVANSAGNLYSNAAKLTVTTNRRPRRPSPCRFQTRPIPAGRPSASPAPAPTLKTAPAPRRASPGGSTSITTRMRIRSCRRPAAGPAARS